MSNIDRRTLVKGSLAAMMAGAALSRSAFADTSEPILLGVSGPLTGPNAQYGTQWKQGFDLALDEIMAELDGSALAARTASAVQSPAAGPATVSAPPFPSAPGMASSVPRLIVMGLVACLFLGAIIRLKKGEGDIPVLFRPVAPAEVAELQSSLAGVYMTGNQPGQHGIVFIAADDLKLFELSALGAPRVVYASGKLGRVGRQLALATDQPGGLIEVTDRDTLVYCGEIYRRVP